MSRSVMAPLKPGWLIVEGVPLFHRTGPAARSPELPVVHVHGFGISGSYLEPTASLLAERYPTYVPDFPGCGRSHRHDGPLGIPDLARILVSYLDEIGLERANFVGNSLGCVILVELAATHRERIDRAVLVSPAGGPNNRPLPRALRQMAADGPREPASLLPIASRDYLGFGLTRGWRLFADMVAYPTLESLHTLDVPTLVVGGARDPLVNYERVGVFAGLPHIDVVRIPGAHALNFSQPAAVARLVRAHLEGLQLADPETGAEVLTVPETPPADVPWA